MAASFENSTVASSRKPSSQPKVFINFRGDALKHQFVGHLMASLKNHLSIDLGERCGELAETFQRIKESNIALVIFSSMYTTSSWCMNELVEITQRVEKGKLIAIPILYKVDASVVKGLEGDFGLNLLNHVKLNQRKEGLDFTSEFEKLKQWKEALDFMSHKFSFVLTGNSDEAEFISNIVKEVKRQLIRISTDQIPDELSEQQEYAFTDACFSSSEKLKTVDSETDTVIYWDANENPKKGEFYGKSRKDDNILDEAKSDASPNLQNIVESKKVESVEEEKKYEHGAESSNMETNNKHIPQYQVFINFRGEDLRFNFVSHLVYALSRKGIDVFMDQDERRDEDPTGGLLKNIKDSKIAVVVFSSRYVESTWCLDELVKIKECMDQGKLKVIPIFYKVEPSQVQLLNGDFGGKLWNFWRLNRDRDIIKWNEALESVASLEALCLKENGSESEFVISIVEEVYKVLTKITLQEGQNPSRGKAHSGREENPHPSVKEDKLCGIEKRMEKLEQKLEFDCKETRIIGVVGMPGIGKTTLAMMLHDKWNCKFVRCVPFLDIRKNSKDYGTVWLRTTLLKVLLGGEIPVINDDTTHDSVKNELLQTKVLIVLDDVSDKEQLEFLLGDLKWIKRGSKIVITTCDKSLMEGLAHDTYLVPQMDHKEAFQLFSYHVSDDQICNPPGKLLPPSSISDIAGGNPLALKNMGRKHRGKARSHLERELKTQSFHSDTRDVWRFYIDQLNEQQRNVFLDILFFFKSEDEYFVRSMLDSGDPDSTDAVSEVTELVDKFLITISDSRVEMNDLVYTFGKHLSSPGRHKLRKYKNIKKLQKLKRFDTNNARGIFLDLSKLSKSILLDRLTFANMHNLRYLKIFESFCRQQCKTDCKLKFSSGINFSLKEVRYLHWEKFPLEKLPSDFKPENLIDLRLPYSKMACVWEGLKETPRLKWVDLSHSSKLLDISALSTAINLQRLNLEGCWNLEKLPFGIQNMKYLVFMNLRGCVRLWSLPKINSASLKILILSNCSRLTKFQLTSQSLEFLHLDGTSIKKLPRTIKNCRRLVLLNMRNCKLLEFIPSSFCELEYLEELILSGCSSLKNIPNVKNSMKHLQNLRLDETGAKEMPNILSSLDVNSVSLLTRLCLSGNDFTSLKTDISMLFNLKWLVVKQCKKLTSIPLLPPSLEYFDAHGCDSLETVANPLALQVVTQEIHAATFNFTNCYNLDQDAKNSIISYTRLKSQLLLSALSRCNGVEGFVSDVLISTCFPGLKVPAWFSHQDFGSVLKPKLPPHWCDNKFTGIALCAVINGNHEHRNHLLVKCNCEFKNEDGSCSRFSFTIGGWSQSGNTPHKIPLQHVFVGYISKTDINNKHGVGGNNEKGCICTQVSLQFEVTDGTKEVVGYKVLKCGFSLVYASAETTTSIVPNTVEKPRALSFEVELRRIKQLAKVLYSTPGKTRIIGVVGEPGIGKTSLATILFEKRGCNFPNKSFLMISKESPLEKLRKTFLEELLKNVDQIVNEETTHEHLKDKLLQDKSFIVLDDVSDRKQLEFLLGNLNWIKKGSKILITTRDKSLLEGFAHGTYDVPELNKREAFQLFSYYAFEDQICSPTRTFLTLSGEFMELIGGNSLAIKLLGTELREENESYWTHKMKTMKQRSGTYLKDIWRSSTYQLNKKHKDMSLDFAKHKSLGKEETNNEIGISIDMSEVTKRIALKRNTFTNMCNLQYLIIYDSCCPRQCKADCKLYFPDGLKFTLEEVTYLYWEKFPLDELPSEFKPKKLIGIMLPYSKIARVWEGIKDTPNLKWIDLSYSNKLLNISAMSKANNLLSLNLEGCLIFDELSLEIENMKSLVFLNLRGCIRLRSFPKIELVSLKTLILTDCIRLKEFQLTSKSLEFLLLDGTSIQELPLTIKGNLRRLVVLNMRNCKMLEFLPSSLCELEYLEELILSDCSSLKNLPEVKHWMKHLKILLFDGAGAKEMPKVLCFSGLEDQTSTNMLLQPSRLPRDVSGISLLQRLCLSGNDIVCLQSDIGQLYHLKWLDVKHCKRLKSIPMLPPRLKYFDAHGCDSLESVANPLALPVVTDHNHATFNFTNCNKLDQEAKDNIISYTRRKSQLVLYSLSRYNGDITSEALIGTCFPGWEVPTWFTHRASGSKLEPKLPPHWFDNRFIGIALCAVIQFPSYIDQSELSVKCSWEFKNEVGIRMSFSCMIGGSRESIESSHVFIGYIRRLDVNKKEKGCAVNETSLKFQVTDGMGEVVVGCEVIKCGFILVYAPDDRENICCDQKSKLLGKSLSDNGIKYQSDRKFENDDDVQYQSHRSLNPKRVVLGEVTYFDKCPRSNEIKFPYPTEISRRSAMKYPLTHKDHKEEQRDQNLQTKQKKARKRREETDRRVKLRQ